MGVKGLWKVLRPAASTQSVTRLAVDGFNTNLDGNRGYRIGIDASIWFGHTEKLKNRQRLGKNHALRTLFFRCTHLLEVPLLPLFVFDGKDRPSVKRGKVVHAKSSKLQKKMQELVDAFGFQWHLAPGEAEAELAYLNTVGVIDAIWTDDVDAFIFGATTLIRNPSNTLSSNAAKPILNAAGRDDGKHVAVLTAHDLASHGDVQLSRGGLILIALLRGGDYNKGVPQIGMQIAHALARCGFGESLLNAVQSLQSEQLSKFLASWRIDLVSELRTNSRGILGKKQTRLAQAFPQDFPNLQVLNAYINPVVSGSVGDVPQFDWHRKLDLAALAEVCERSLGWDDATVLKRFKSLVWTGAALRALRDSIVSMDSIPDLQHTRHKALGDPLTDMPAEQSEPPLDASLIVGIHRQREHTSTDFLPELQVEVNTACFVRATQNALSTLRHQPPVHPPAEATDEDERVQVQKHAGASTRAKSACGSVGAKDDDTLRIWLPACIVRLAVPQLAAAHGPGSENKQPTKRPRDKDQALDGTARGSRKAVRTSADKTSPRGRGDSAPKRTQSPVIDLASDSDGDVIVISDSDDVLDGVGESAGVIIDLTS
ncbi:PIN domain-like protein [Auricularia subglabra TFB-10046 SS5]|nr:PIN domain-like protein [Auricularia subglabra TFB-10046 SS5]